jgi:hypothetical protein
MSFARWIAGAATGQEFSDPDTIQATGQLSESNVDEWTTANVGFAGNTIGAQLFTGIFADSDCTAEVIGTADVPAMGDPKIILVAPGKEPTEVPYDSTNLSVFTIEADAVSEAILSGAKECRYMTLDDTIGQVKALDAWRAQIGLKYRAD